MLDSDAHIHAFQVDRTERASRDRINQAKEHWQAYLQGRAELELLLNKQAILLSAWRAEDRARRLAPRLAPRWEALEPPHIKGSEPKSNTSGPTSNAWKAGATEC